MHWKTKSRVQNIISLLPPKMSYGAYYQMQRHFGGLRKLNPIKRFKAAIKTWELIQTTNHNPIDKIFFEVGTGRAPIIPLAYWLMGARKTITVDLNPYMKNELVQELFQYLITNKNEITSLFGPLLNLQRLNNLLAILQSKNHSVSTLLATCNIDYIAPGDASCLKLGDNSIDFHTSYTVFEHIPKNILSEILQERNRIMQPSGVFVHQIDYSDHFSHSDNSISPINFLQYSDTQWHKFAGNRYMYTNRLRHDDMLKIFNENNHEILLNLPTKDMQSSELISSGHLKVDRKFLGKTNEILSTTSSWLVSKHISS